MNILKIACGCYHSIALCENGHVYTFGRGNHGQLGHGTTEDQKLPKEVSTLHDKKVIDIAGGFYHTIVLVKLKKNSGESKLSSDMRKIINESSRADVTFVLEGGKVFHAHRCILLARCRNMEELVRSQGVKSDDRERLRWGINNQNHLKFELPNFKQKAFQALMEYIYTDNIK